MIKKIFLGLIVLFIAAQFYRPARNLSASTGPNDISVKHPLPPAVKPLLEHACYDCHSNNTKYPWYANVQPVAWWLDWHINDGKRHLNFSEFGRYTPKRAAEKLDNVIDELEQHSMPLKSYTWMHPEARLTAAEIKTLTAWAEDLRQEIAPE
jgi:hypothetical protein